ncbi:hypothetical protein EON82_19120, partial [bacterium]
MNLEIRPPSNNTLARQEEAPLAIVEPEVDVREYLAAFKRRWPWMLLVAGVVFGVGAYRTLRQPKIYASSTTLVVTTKSTGMKTGAAAAGIMGELADLQQARDVDTQAQIIGSPDLIEKAYAKLSDEERARGYKNSGLPGWAYSVASKPETDIVVISAQAYDPEVAASFANTIAATYREQDLERNSAATRQAREYVEREMKTAQAELRSASARLANFKRQT